MQSIELVSLIWSLHDLEYKIQIQFIKCVLRGALRNVKMHNEINGFLKDLKIYQCQSVSGELNTVR